MKAKKLFKYLLAVVAIVAMASCSDDFVSPEEQMEVPDQLTLTLTIPNYIKQEVSTRATAPLSVICQDAAGKSLSVENVDFPYNGSEGGTSYEITVPIHKQTVKLQFVMNKKITDKDADLTALTAESVDDDVLWGTAELKNLISKTASERQVMMMHNTAKVRVWTTDPNFKVVSFLVCGTTTRGTVAPDMRKYNDTIPTLPASPVYNVATKDDEKNMILVTDKKDEYQFIFESDETEYKNSSTPWTRIIVKGKYRNKERYYVMAFAKRWRNMPDEDDDFGYETPGKFSYKKISVVRNFFYDVVIDEVHTDGWATFEEALRATADNRNTVTIIDTNEGVNDIIANADYMLGVQDAIEVSATDGTANVTVVTSYPANSYAGEQRLTFTCLSDPNGMINLAAQKPTVTLVSQNDNASAGRCKTSYVYNVAIPMVENKTQSSRKATLEVRSGQLTRTFTVTQAARDYVRDPSRKVSATIGSQTISDYFTWISNTVKGATPEGFAQKDVRRDDGLIFPAVAGAPAAVYTIPALTGDQSYAITNNSNFRVDKSGNNYVVKFVGSTSPNVETGVFTVKNADGYEINYPLYRTGILHELTSSHASLQRPGGAVSGWFYYELVKVGGKWVLDRNLGAESNHPYITTSSATLKNVNAIGGYFKISTTKSNTVNSPQTIISSLGVYGFDIPTRASIEAMGISASNVASEFGSSEAIVVANAMTQSPSKLGRIYFPHGGYYEDVDLRYETHANLWTKTLVAGNQGFSEGSPDFGYWYQYFDSYTSKTGFSNMRFFDGSTGEAPTAESAYKYMPIRLVWN